MSKHYSYQFDDADYEFIREAAHQARLPIKQWVARAAIAAAKQAALATGLPLPRVPAAPQAHDTTTTAAAKETQTENLR